MRLIDADDLIVMEFRGIEFVPKEFIDDAPTIEPERTGDYKYEAVKGLDSFTKAFCRDDQVKDDLLFRCRNCAFEMPDKKCLVKVMARRLCPEYKDFGSMGDL